MSKLRSPSLSPLIIMVPSNMNPVDRHSVQYHHLGALHRVRDSIILFLGVQKQFSEIRAAFVEALLWYLSHLGSVRLLLDITLQGRGAKLSLHSRMQRQNRFLYNVRPTSPTSVPQTLPWTSFTGLKHYSFWASLQEQSFEKRSAKEVQNGVPKWVPEHAVVKG